MRLINKTLTESIFDSLKEDVTISNGETTVVSSNMGVTVEDNGNVITSGSNTTVNIEQGFNNVGTDYEETEDIIEPEEIDDINMDLTDEELPEENVAIDDSEDSIEDELDESAVNEEVLEKKDEETEEELNNSKTDNEIKDETDTELKEADGYNQNQNVEIFQNPEFDYQILDITELDNVDSGDVRAVDMANILNSLDESLTNLFGDPNYVLLNSFLTRKGTHKKTNESYSSAILEISLPKVNRYTENYKNTFFLEVYGNKLLKECVVRDSSNHIIKEYSGKSINPVEHFKNVILDIDRSRRLTEEVSDDAYIVAEAIAKDIEGKDTITWDEFNELFEKYTNEVNPNLLSDDLYYDFEQDIRGILSHYGWATIFEGENEGGLTTKEITNEAVEFMVNKPYSDKGINFADGKAIEKDEKRQENHMKQHAKFDKKKKFDAGKEPDQNNTTGETLEDLTDTEKTPKLPKAKKVKVDAKTIKVKEIKESEELTEMGNFTGRMSTLRAAGDRAATYRNDMINQKNEKIKELFNRLKEIQDDVTELKEIGKYVKLYDLKDRYGMWLDASGRGLDYENSEEPRETLLVDTDKILMSEPNLQTSEVTVEELTKPNPFHHKNVFIRLATEMLDNYPGYIKAVNQMIDDYDLKYPVKSQEEISESVNLKEAEDELLDEPIITDGTEPDDEIIEESGSDVAIFHRKPASVDAMRAAEENGITVNKSNYKIIGTKELSGEEFQDFANHLSSNEYDWLEEYDDTSNSGEFKCVEVINLDDDTYTLLVDPQGYKYARYCAIKDKIDEEELLEPEEELIDETSEEIIEEPVE